MSKVARYIIVLDRMDDDEACGNDGHWPINDEEGMVQVAEELQYVMDNNGQPAGFFRVVARIEVEYSGEIVSNVENKVAHQWAAVAIDNTRTY